MKKPLYFLLFVLVIAASGCESIPDNADVRIVTDYGNIYIDLYDDTPKHKDNFLLLAQEGFYDGTAFHRVMNKFMIQGGDPNSREGASGTPGNGGPGYVLPREILPHHYHKRGAVAAARQPDQANPQWQSSGSQFFIVQGDTFPESQLDEMAMQIPQLINSHARYVFESDPKHNWVRSIDFEALQAQYPDSAAALIQKINNSVQEVRDQFPTYQMTDEMRQKYLKDGGAPFLDGMYTVFGEVVKGMEVVDAIADAEVQGETPVRDIRFEVEVL